VASKYQVVKGLLRLAVKYFVRWLVREFMEELAEGVLLRVVIDGQVYWLKLQLVTRDMVASGKGVIDAG